MRALVCALLLCGCARAILVPDGSNDRPPAVDALAAQSVDAVAAQSIDALAAQAIDAVAAQSIDAVAAQSIDALSPGIVVDAPLPDAFVPDAAPPDAAPCTLSPNAGCATGQACDLGPGMTVCRVAGAGGETVDHCVATDCAAGFTCHAVAGAGDPSCVAFCHDDRDCSPPGGRCVIAISGATLCSQSCDPIAGTGCPPSWACQIEATPAGTDYTECMPAGTGGSACTRDLDCQAGYSCSPTGTIGASACQKRCLLADPHGCDSIPGTGCTALGTHPTIGGNEYGICHN